MYQSPLHHAEDAIIRRYLLRHGLAGENAGSVLDLGCGTAGYLDLVRNACPLSGGFTYVGLDRSPRMIQVAQRKHDSASTTWIEADMQVVERWAANSFDTVIGLFGSLSYASDMAAMFRAIDRLVAPGGRFFVMVYGERYRTRPSYVLNQLACHSPATFVNHQQLQSMLPQDGWYCRTFGFSALAEDLSGKLSERSLERYLRWETAWIGNLLPDRCYWLCAHGVKNQGA